MFYLEYLFGGDQNNSSIIVTSLKIDNINFKKLKQLYELFLLRVYLNKRRDNEEGTTESEEERNKEKEENLDDAFLNNYLTSIRIFIEILN